jgi:hypothetical protein
MLPPHLPVPRPRLAVKKTKRVAKPETAGVDEPVRAKPRLRVLGAERDRPRSSLKVLPAC